MPHNVVGEFIICHIISLTLFRTNPTKPFKGSFILCSLFTLNACTSPSTRFHNTALAHQFSAKTVTTSLFQHVIYSKLPSNLHLNSTLHIYLDGDGTPWLRNRWIAKDPSARNPMILGLMAQDKMPAILLGRPCYYGLHNSSGCHYRLWTSHRYSKTVVDSMARALSKWLSQYPSFQQLTFIGYSGGGSLAVLLAPYFPQTIQVVTIAANLDTDSWSQLHNYAPLVGSLNPIAQPPLKPHINQLHIAGSLDTNIPSKIIESYAKHQYSAKFKMYINQHCCWNMHWPAILSSIDCSLKAIQDLR